jgi:cell division protein FtsW (lipid II flippase)
MILAAAESRYHREERLDVAQTRLWGLVALVVGLAGSGAALFSVTSDTVKVVVPIAAAIVGVLVGVAAAYAPHGTLRRWLPRGARAGQPAPPDSLARIGDALEDQRRDARRSAITVWRGA